MAKTLLACFAALSQALPAPARRTQETSMQDPDAPLDLGPPPPVFIPPLGPVAGATPPAPVAFSERPPQASGGQPAIPAPAPPPAAAPPPATGASGAAYTVKSGDTLSSIASR